jgi:hypothetical protein
MLLPTGSAIAAGAAILAVITIAYGGTFVLRVVTGKQGANALQKSFFRAGHAHAGVLVILGLVVALVLGAVQAPSWSQFAADGVLASAIVIPSGFFLSVIGHDPAKPSRGIALVWVGFGLLTASLLVSGITIIGAAIA